MKPIIEVKNISKKYKYGQNTGGYITLRDTLNDWLKLPFKIFKKDPGDSLEKGEFWALKDISFKVKQGEVIGVIGGNGAGKSTLLKIFSQITPPTSGQITLRGRVASLLEVGTGFNPELTGRENIYLNGSILGMTQKEIRSKFDEIVAFAEIGDFLDTVVKHYSSGMYMRLAFSVAAHLQPEILLVDEVLAVGDVKFQKKCLDKMKDVSQSGRTIIFVSHNLEAVNQLCNRCILLEKGRVKFVGDTKECLKLYSNAQQLPTTKISDSITYDNHLVNINSVRCQGKTKSLVEVDTDTKMLTFDIDIYVTQSLNLSVLGFLKDDSNNVIGVFPPHIDGQLGGTQVTPPGNYRLKYSISIPPLHKGYYVIELLIAEPGIQSLVYINDAAHFDYKGTISSYGHAYPAGINKAGYLLFDSQLKILTNTRE